MSFQLEGSALSCWAAGHAAVLQGSAATSNPLSCWLPAWGEAD